MSTKEIAVATWKKVSLAILKSFRGLICEKKDGGWELSLGRVSFWIVFSHCMYIWNRVGDVVREIVEPIKNEATVAADSIAVGGVKEEVIQVVEIVVKYAEISQSELYVLFALLGYAGIKLGKDAVQGFATAWKNGQPQ